MNPVCKQQVISMVFHEIYPGSFLCKNCFSKELFYHAFSVSDILIHIYFKHRGIWNSAIFLPEAISNSAWLRLFKKSEHTMNIECKHCDYEFNDNVRLRFLHNHIKARHSIILLALSLLNE